MLQELPGLGWRMTDPILIRQWLADPGLSAGSPRLLLTVLGLDGTRFGREMLSWFLYQDEPEHQRRRRAVQAAFTARAMAALEDSIRATTEELVDALPSTGRFDLAVALCEPLAGTTIGRLLGTDPVHDPVLAAAARAIMAAIGGSSAESFAAAERALDEMAAVVQATVAGEGPGLLRALHTAEALDDDDLVSVATLLLFAGQGTTRDLMANAFTRALADRDLWADLGRDAALAAGVVEESLRLEPAVSLAARVATADVEIDGSRVAAGETIWFDLAAAGQALAGERPEVFDPHRPSTSTIAFGHGPHHCLGASLARAEAGIALSVTAAARPGLALEGSPEDLAWIPNLIYRGRQSVPVVDDRGPAETGGARSRPGP
jgi:cytochrome P450